jgi:hypothetical protein
MFEQLIPLAQEKIGDFLQQQGFGGTQGGEAARAAGEGIVSQISERFSGGDYSGIMELFSGQETDSTSGAVSSMLPGVAETLSGKLGIDLSQAEGLAGGIIPSVMNMLNDKVKQAGADGFDVQSLLGNLGQQGGIGGMLGGLVGNFLGGDKGGSAAGDMVNDLLKRFLK